jgi:phage tail sheath protein FI
MPTYLSPGVYTEEVSAGPVPIQGVSTSTLGMAGPTERGPATGAQLVTSWSEYERIYGGPLSADKTNFPLAVRGFFDNGGQLLYCARVVGAGAVPASNENPAPENPAPENPAPENPAAAKPALVLTAAGPGAWGNNVFVRLGPATMVATKRKGVPDDWFRVTVLYYTQPPPVPLVDPLEPANISDLNRREPDMVEDFDNLDFEPTATNDVVSTVNGSSTLIHAAWSGAPARPVDQGFTELGQGTDVAPTASDYVGDMTKPSDQRTGLAALEGIEDIALLAVPDQTHPALVAADRGEIADAVVSQCERLRNRFSIFGGPLGAGDDPPPVPLSDPNAIITNLPSSSSFTAIYYPNVHVYDSLTGGADYITPVGHVAGIYARTDDEQGVEHAPANAEVLGILDINTSPTQGPLQYAVTRGDQDILNPAGVCALRDFRSSQLGVRVWGARTLSADPQWRYVNVRRTFIYLEQSIERGTQWVVFENNDEPTWARVVRSVSNFLESFWRDGGLVGTTPAEAFFVRCDRTTMTPGDIDDGRLICLIGVAPVKPAEFVIFRFSQLTVQATS